MSGLRNADHNSKRGTFAVGDRNSVADPAEIETDMAQKDGPLPIAGSITRCLAYSLILGNLSKRYKDGKFRLLLIISLNLPNSDSIIKP